MSVNYHSPTAGKMVWSYAEVLSKKYYTLRRAEQALFHLQKNKSYVKYEVVELEYNLTSFVVNVKES